MTQDPLVDGLCTCTDVLQEVPCGCGEHRARLYRDHVVHWRGEHWRIVCAFERLLAEVDRLKEALAIVAGRTDREGVDHGAQLHDVIKIGQFAERILDGQTAAEALST